MKQYMYNNIMYKAKQIVQFKESTLIYIFRLFTNLQNV